MDVPRDCCDWAMILMMDRPDIKMIPSISVNMEKRGFSHFLLRFKNVFFSLVDCSINGPTRCYGCVKLLLLISEL